MVEVKISYFPYRCGFGGKLCVKNPKDCTNFDLDLDDESYEVNNPCRNSFLSDEVCVMARTVKNFEFDGFDGYGNFLFRLGNKVFSGETCYIETISVDGKMIVDNREVKL